MFITLPKQENNCYRKHIISVHTITHLFHSDNYYYTFFSQVYTIFNSRVDVANSMLVQPLGNYMYTDSFH